MYNRPTFKRHLTVKAVPPDILLLRHETGCDVFEGRLLVLLANLLDGKHTVSDIVAELDDHATAIDVQFGLSFLDEQGLLMDATDGRNTGEDVFVDSLNLPQEVVQERLRNSSVSVTALGGISPEPLIAALRSLGIRTVDSGNLTIVLTDDYLVEELRGFNKDAYEGRRPWLLVKPVGSLLWFGPLFQQGSPCWECLARRLRQNRMAGGFLELLHPNGGNVTPPQPALPTTIQTALDIAATETWKWIVQDGISDLCGTIVTFDTKTLVSRKHVVVPYANCAVCGGPNKAEDCSLPLVLTSRKKQFAADGGHRAEPPEITFQKYAHHISPITGVVDRFETYDGGLGEWLHVYVAEHLSTPEDELRISQNRKMRRPSAGKGMTDTQARTSALSEALERYSGIYRGDERAVKATYRALGSEALHPDICQNFSDKQFEDRRRWNARHPRMHWVADPFDEETEIDWCAAWSLTENRTKYVPTGYCYYRYPMKDGQRFFRGDSNGCAGGSCLEEAILQGFLELVERDCTAIWWYNRIRRPSVDLAGFNHPYFIAVAEHYGELSRDLWVLDITNDLRIPTFAAISTPALSDGKDAIMGFGTHWDPVIAIARALTEVNQFLPHTVAGGFPNHEWEPDGYSFLHPDATQERKRAKDYTYTRQEDLLEDVLSCVRLTRSLGMEMLVFDQTRADIGLRVVKVIVPGLRHVWARFGPGRLYEAPLKLGWLSAPKSEEEFDRICFFA